MPDPTTMRAALRTIASAESGVWGTIAREALKDDPMGAAGWNRPAPASLDDLVALLEDVLDVVREHDSFEGFVQWVMPTDEPELVDADFGVLARYRVGNSMGQGSLRVFGGGS
jgi:hypothetical protein